MKLLRYSVLLLLFSSLFFASCKKDELLTDSSGDLAFSVDTVMFDTVFTAIGSTTKIFKVYNTHDQPMNISNIHLAMGNASPFKLNVDGISGKSIDNVDILANDSLFVFVQVTIDPNNISSPVVVKDSIVFQTNGNIQDVKLMAIGQDVYLHIPDHFPLTGFPAYSITGREGVDTTLPNDKPHLFFGYTIIDSDCKLTMLPGTKCYFYNNAVLMAFEDATLNVQGTHGNEVTFQGYRLEPDYKEIPGQWGKIWLWPGSKNNVIDWAIIKNGGIGIQSDTVVTPGTPNLKISNTIIKNMTAAALYGQGTHIWASNCVFANCGQYVAALAIGGKYKFEHCTLANFWDRGEARTTPVLAINNYYGSGASIFVRPIDSCNFINCIIYGNIDDEVAFDSITGAGSGYFNYKFEHCIVKSTFNMNDDGLHYDSVFRNMNPDFQDQATDVNNFQLGTGSNSIDKGRSTLIATDLNFHSRDMAQPDLGAYEH